MNYLELLRPAAVFAHVVETGSFRAAAERLGLSAPYVSQLIADLEARLGRQLLYRSTRKLTLSSDGERFLPSAQAIAAALVDGVGAFRDGSAPLQGRLQLNVPSLLAAPLFASVISEFQALHPELEISVMLDDQHVDPLERTADLTIRIGFDPQEGHRAVKLFETTGIVCCSYDMGEQIRTVQDLTKFRWIKTPHMPQEIAFHRRLPLENRLNDARISPQQSLVTNSAQFTRELVQKSVGWAVFPEFSVQMAITQGAMGHALQDWTTGPIGVYCVYSARHASLSNAKSFVQFMQKRLR